MAFYCYVVCRMIIILRKLISWCCGASEWPNLTLRHEFCKSDERQLIPTRVAVIKGTLQSSPNEANSLVSTLINDYQKLPPTYHPRTHIFGMLILPTLFTQAFKEGPITQMIEIC